jgi:hypothetical protein
MWSGIVRRRDKASFRSNKHADGTARTRVTPSEDQRISGAILVEMQLPQVPYQKARLLLGSTVDFIKTTH